MEFNENPSGGSRVVLCGRTDTHDVASRRLSQLAFRTPPYHIREPKVWNASPDSNKTLAACRKVQGVLTFIQNSDEQSHHSI